MDLSQARVNELAVDEITRRFRGVDGASVSAAGGGDADAGHAAVETMMLAFPERFPAASAASTASV